MDLLCWYAATMIAYAAQIFSIGLLQAQDDRYTQGNLLYEKKDYQGAIRLYDEMIEDGMSSYGLWYNRGLAQLQLSNVGEAILSLERAARWDETEEVLSHLQMANGLIENEIPEFSDFFLTTWWNTMVRSVGVNGFASLGLLVFILACLLLFLSWTGRVVMHRAELKAAVLAFVAMVLVLLSVSAQNTQESDVQAIVMTESELFEGSDERSPQIRLLSVGVKVRVLDRIGEWYKVRLPDKEIGWVMIRQIEII